MGGLFFAILAGGFVLVTAKNSYLTKAILVLL